MDALYHLAAHLTRDRTAAQDLVQEAYLRAFRFFDTYTAGTNIRAWLFRILRNTFINRYRAARARPDEVDFDTIEPVYDTVVDGAWSSGSQAPSPEASVLDGIVDEEISEAIASLPEEYRTVVVLALVEDLSYREIATILSIPVGTVMSRLHRGRKRLQERLREFAAGKGIGRPPEPVDED
jgi:RNA polymerase sigma-70 factor (ECF subfamily)